MSVSSYVRMPCSVEEAMARYGRWIGRPEVRPPQLVKERDAIDLALEDDKWLGIAVYIYPSGSETVIEELSGSSDRSAPEWVALAEGGDLVYASYNDSINFAELIVVEKGRLVRHILDNEDDPSTNVNIGRLPEEAKDPMNDWIDVTGWVEADDDKLAHAEQGWLWIHERPESWSDSPF